MKRFLWPAACVAALVLGWTARDVLTWTRASLSREWRERAALKDCGSDLPWTVLDVVHRGDMPLAQFLALWKTESDGNPNARSPKGAIGAGQILPEVAAKYGFSPEDMRVPELNAEVTIKHFGACREAFAKSRNVELDAICAYNVGPTAWRDILNTKRAPPAETERQRRVYISHKMRYARMLEE